MALHLLRLILITITTTITNFACGELFLKMPLTINPVVQEAITIRSQNITERFYSEDPLYFSRLTPADIVSNLGQGLPLVMRNKIVGAVVLGIAAKLASGLQADQLVYEANNSWTVNVSLTDIRGILTEDEKYLLPLADNITLTALQNLGLRALQKRFNVSLGRRADPLHLSTATTFQSIQEDWIRVVKFITETNVNRIAARYEVSVDTLATALNLSSSELYNMTLNELDGLLSTEFKFVKGSLEVVLPTVATTTTETPTQTTTEEKPITTIPPSTESPTTTATQFLTTQGTVRSSLPTTAVGNQTTDGTVSLPFSTTRRSLKTSAIGRPTQGSSDGTTTNLALFVGVAVGLLLLLVASSTVWCFKRKRRHSSNDTKNKPKNNNDIKMNNFWIEKTDGELPHSPEVTRQEGHHFVRRPSGSAAGVDSRFKGLKYVPTSTTFAPDAPLRISSLGSNFENDYRREIFV